MNDDHVTTAATPEGVELPGYDVPAAPEPKRRGRPARGAAKAAAKPTRTPPPKPDAAPAPEPKRGPGRPSNSERIGRQVAELHVLAGTLLTLYNPAAAAALVQQSDAIGKAWAGWAETSPRVRRALDGAMNAGGAASVLLAYLPVVIAVASAPRPSIESPAAAAPEGTGAVADPDAAAFLAAAAGLSTFTVGNGAGPG